jgi:hypothetical protein
MNQNRSEVNVPGADTRPKTNKERWAKFQTLWPKQSRAEMAAYLDAPDKESRYAIIDRWIAAESSSDSGASR